MIYVFWVLGAALSGLTVFLHGLTGGALLLYFVLLTLGYGIGLQIAYVIILWLICLFIDRRKPQRENDPFFRTILNWTAELLFQATRVQVKVTGMELLPPGRYLLVSNHLSGYDPIITAWVLRHDRIAFVTKPENMKIPIAGSIIHKCCYLPIDRENAMNAVKTIQAAVDLINRDVVSIGIYPEGTRNRSDEPLLPFRSGAFKIATKAKVPVVVAAVRGTDRIVHNFPWRPTTVTVEFCRVIDAETVATSKTVELSETVRETLLSRFS
ncbi:MAG: 1-acyl-sn-glycerol-3-phosphate acyltransferase [Clostridiales bacterium]|nr:1-acyl-sn-glycerol-3-phosphate acyltransferase [Clostridiales bacterium]